MKELLYKEAAPNTTFVVLFCVYYLAADWYDFVEALLFKNGQQLANQFIGLLLLLCFLFVS